MQFSVSFGCLGWRFKIVKKCHLYFSLRKKFLIPLFYLGEKRGLFGKLYIIDGGPQFSTAKFLSTQRSEKNLLITYLLSYNYLSLNISLFIIYLSIYYSVSLQHRDFPHIVLARYSQGETRLS